MAPRRAWIDTYRAKALVQYTQQVPPPTRGQTCRSLKASRIGFPAPTDIDRFEENIRR